MLPRSSHSKRQKTYDRLKNALAPLKLSWPGLKKDDLKGISQKISKRFGWGFPPRPFQLEAIEAQLLRKDVLIHAGTGSGKTAVAAGPHAHEKVKGVVTFMVSPLIALQEEQVTTFRDEFKLTATAINSANNSCTKEVMDAICRGEWQIVIISPEMMLSKRFIKNVLRNRELGPRLLSVVVDEAHVVSHWGSSFRKKYGSLGILRAILPKGTLFVAMSATLPPRVRKDVLNKLQFDPTNFVNLNIGNDRPNVSIVVRAMQHAMNTYNDLDFLIPDGMNDPTMVKQTLIYADKISDAILIEEHLYERLPENFRKAGIIRPYNAAYTTDHRIELMALFKSGVVRILICTDAAGMGCNIPDVDIVVQWKLPATVSAFVQRAGRAARASGRTGLAVLLVERTTYDADLSRLEEAVNNNGKKKSIRQSSTYPKASKQYAIDHGLRRGMFGGEFDGDLMRGGVPLDRGSIDEGLYSLVQTGTCRRIVLTKIYGNHPPHPTVPCCDICDPSLLDQTRPARPEANPRKQPLKSGLPNHVVQKALREWRKSIWTRDFEDAVFGPSAIVGDKMVDMLASVGPILSLAELERVVGENWAWFGKYGDELLAKLSSLSIPPIIPKPTQQRASKRTLDDGTGQETRVRGKKKRSEPPTQSRAITSITPTVTSNPSTTSSMVTTFTNPSTPIPAPQFHPYASVYPPFTPGFPAPQFNYYSSPIHHTPIYSQYPMHSNPPQSSSQPIPRLQFRHYCPPPCPSPGLGPPPTPDI